MNSVLDALRQEDLAGIERLLAKELHGIDPVAWCDDVSGDFLWSKQREVARALVLHSRVAVRAAHSVGKSMLAARLVLWWVDTHPKDESMVVVTAASMKQATLAIWAEMRRAHKRAGLPGTITNEEWKIDGHTVAIARKPADHDPTAIQGIHARHLLVIIDEACQIPEPLWVSLDSLVSNSGSTLALGNPDNPATHFARVCAPGSGWRSIKIDASSSPNFTDEQVPESLKGMLISPSWVKEKAYEWGEEDPRYLSKVLGEFPPQSEDSLFRAIWIEEANERWELAARDEAEPLVLGVDVAHRGTAETVVVARQGRRAWVAATWRGKDTMQTVGLVKNLMRELGASSVHVDAIGVGAGVVDRLEEQGVSVVGIIASEKAYDPTLRNVRAEGFWRLRQLLERGEIALKPDDVLAKQLLDLEWHFNSSGQVQIESKEDMRKRGMPSPDRADALAIAFAPLLDRARAERSIMVRESLSRRPNQMGQRELTAMSEDELMVAYKRGKPRAHLSGFRTARRRGERSPFGLGRARIDREPEGGSKSRGR